MKKKKIDITLYRTRLERSHNTFGAHKRDIRSSRQAVRQIIPDTDLLQATNMVPNNIANSSITNASASKLCHPGLAYIVKSFIEGLTALPFRFEYQSNTKEGEISREVVEMRLRTILTQTDITNNMNTLYWHSVVDGLAVTQTIAYEKKEELLINGEVEAYNRGHLISLLAYDPIKVYLDPNCSPDNIVNTSDWIITTVGTYDEDYIERTYPEFRTETDGSLDRAAALVVDEFTDNEKDAGVNKGGGAQQYLVREYYSGDGFYYTVINDAWMSKAKPVRNNIADRIPFSIIQTIPDPDNAYGETLYGLLRSSLIMASKGMNSIIDTTQLNADMPWLVWADTELSGMAIEGLPNNTFISVERVAGVNDLNHAIMKPRVPEVTEGVNALVSWGEQFLWLLSGTNPTAIGGQQSPQIMTNGIAQMLQNASIRSNNAIASRIEMTINHFLWDCIRIFFSDYDKFKLSADSIPREFLSNFENIRVVPGSYLAEDMITRMDRAREVLNLASAMPDSFKLQTVIKDFLSALGISVPESILKTAKEAMKEQLAMLIPESIAKGADQVEIQKMVDQLAELAKPEESSQTPTTV